MFLKRMPNNNNPLIKVNFRSQKYNYVLVSLTHQSSIDDIKQYAELSPLDNCNIIIDKTIHNGLGKHRFVMLTAKVGKLCNIKYTQFTNKSILKRMCDSILKNNNIKAKELQAQ